MICQSAYAIGQFHLHHDDEPDPSLVCDGWFHSVAPISRMTIVVAGAPDRSLPVVDFGLPSPDVASYAGPAASNARFRLQTRLSAHAGLDLTASRLVVDFAHGDQASVGLGRSLVTTRAFPKADRDLVMRFEGLGDNCEFGLMQRHVGLERLGLLRYAGARQIDRLIAAIDDRFEGFATTDDLAMSRFGDEWIASSRRYGFTFHTGAFASATPEDKIRQAESTKLTFMAQLLVEDLETAHKIFVRRVDENDVQAGIWALFQALRRSGPCKLLWVTRAQPGHPHGHVERLADGLYRGFHDALAPYGNAHGFDPDGWITLLRATETLIEGPDTTPHRKAWWRRFVAKHPNQPVTA